MHSFNQLLYQIYPIGFCGAPTSNDGILTPRIRKIATWAKHLEKLGVGSIILNPVFESDSHGYDTRDFSIIDRRLGTNEDFVYVCEKLHESGINILLDGVFNHVGRGFWAFLDVLKNREKSKYKDWFYIHFDGNSNYNDGFWYEGWEGHFELVKLNLKNPEVVAHLLSCVELWIDEFGIDGLRLDVAYSLDHDFLRQLHTVCKTKNPDFLLIGEVLFGDYNQIVNPDMLDSCTNYEVYKGLYSSLNSYNLFEISYSLNRQYGPENWTLYRGKHLMNFLDNHDVTRIASILTNEKHLPIAYALLFTIPGIPCIYYGSEWGIKGKKEPTNDYALRPCLDKPEWNALTDYIQKLSSILKENEAFSIGDYSNPVVTNQQLIFERKTAKDRILVAVNIVDQDYTAYHNELKGKFVTLLPSLEKGKSTKRKKSSEPSTVTLNGQFIIPSYSVQILRFLSND